MRIGIVTFYRVANYGAMLQAYALWKFLEKRGHLVEFIDVLNCSSRRRSFCQCFVTRSLKGLRHKLTDYVQHHIADFAKTYPQTRRFVDYEDLMDNCPYYDVLIAGSDQVWNSKWTDKDAVPVVFLGFAPEGCARLSYAASFGSSKWERMETSKDVGCLLREFKGISVREQSGVRIVDSLSGRRAEYVLDPTLLWTDNFYRGVMRNNVSCSCPYVFHYFLHAWTDDKMEMSCLDAVMRNLGIQTVLSDSSPCEGFLAPLLNALGVKDRISLPRWIGRIAHADFVVTNSFHGTVFSILFRRPFVTVLIRGKMSGMNERVISLLGGLGLLGRVASDEREVVSAIHSPIEWANVFSRLEVLRKKSEAFFERNAL